MVQKGEQKIDAEDGQTEPEQKKFFEILSRARPARDHGPGQREEKKRRINREMHREKREQFSRMNPERLIKASAISQVPYGGPTALCVPDGPRNNADDETEEK